MSFLETINPLYSLSGPFAGTLVGFTGMGGGALMTPLLVLLFGIHPATAVGTDPLYAGLTKSVGIVIHGRNKTVDWQITRLLATGSIAPAEASQLGRRLFRRTIINGSYALRRTSARLTTVFTPWP